MFDDVIDFKVSDTKTNLSIKSVLSEAEMGGTNCRVLQLTSLCDRHNVNMRLYEFLPGATPFCHICSSEMWNLAEQKKEMERIERENFNNNNATRLEVVKTIGDRAFGFPTSSFKHWPQSKVAYDEIINGSKGGWYFYGFNNTGKTLLAKIILRKLAFRNMSFSFIVSHDLATQWGGSDPSLRYHISEKLKNYDVLVIDDLGRNTEAPGYQELLFTIMNYRIKEYSGDKLTIFTSNQSIDDLSNFYEKSRLKECREVLFG